MRGHDPITFQALQDALATNDPVCLNDPRFTADELTRGETTEMQEACAMCPIAAACKAFAQASKPPAGFYAGQQYPLRRRTTND